MNYQCQICQSTGEHPVFRVLENMFGWGDAFDYFECGNCGCLQLADPPADLARFYPPNYYSFNLPAVPIHGARARLGAKRDLWAATGRGLIGRLAAKVLPPATDVVSLMAVPARKNGRILDVGCGKGRLLAVLHRAGLENLSGVDPFLAQDAEVAAGVWVRKLALEEVAGKYDLIMLHHVFEHVQDGAQLLKAAAQRLAVDGRILLRFPTPESDAWKEYGVNWVQVDAPRHIFLHTRKSLGLLAQRAGLEVERVWCDSSVFQFWASELYRMGLSLQNENGAMRVPEDYFSAAKLQEFSRRTEAVNRAGRGDQMAVILKRIEKSPTSL